jgi:hypothetical protein
MKFILQSPISYSPTLNSSTDNLQERPRQVTVYANAVFAGLNQVSLTEKLLFLIQSGFIKWDFRMPESIQVIISLVSPTSINFE